MSRCPNCSARLSLWEISWLSSTEDLMQCKNCQSVLGLKSSPKINGGVMAWTAVLIVFIASIIFNLSLLIFLLASVLFLVAGLTYMVKHVAFEVVGDGTVSIDELHMARRDEFGQIHAEQESGRYELKFQNKRSEELETIVTENGWQDGAKIAASRILNERDKGT